MDVATSWWRPSTDVYFMKYSIALNLQAPGPCPLTATPQWSSCRHFRRRAPQSVTHTHDHGFLLTTAYCLGECGCALADGRFRGTSWRCGPPVETANAAGMAANTADAAATDGGRVVFRSPPPRVALRPGRARRGTRQYSPPSATVRRAGATERSGACAFPLAETVLAGSCVFFSSCPTPCARTRLHPAWGPPTPSCDKDHSPAAPPSPSPTGPTLPQRRARPAPRGVLQNHQRHTTVSTPGRTGTRAGDLPATAAAADDAVAAACCGWRRPTQGRPWR